MHPRRFTLAPVFTAFLLLCIPRCSAQQGFSQQADVGHAGTSGSAQGNLAVTATVVASVGIVIGPDGEQRLIVANAADPSDNVSRLQAVPTVALTSNAGSSKVDNAPKTTKKLTWAIPVGVTWFPRSDQHCEGSPVPAAA